MIKRHDILLIVNVFLSDEMNNYALSEDPSTGDKNYVRFNSRAGESVTLNNVRIDSDTMKALKDAVSKLLILMYELSTNIMKQAFTFCFSILPYPL